jgi:hypothetical protein
MWRAPFTTLIRSQSRDLLENVFKGCGHTRLFYVHGMIASSIALTPPAPSRQPLQG